MNTHFKKIYATLHAQREELLSRVERVPAEMYNQPPAPGKWSISQILTHILTSERLSIGYMKKKSQGIDQIKNSGPVESMRLWLLILSQRIPVKYNAPKVLVQNTPEALPLEELIPKWNSVREELKTFLDSIEEKNVRKVIYKHPFAGRLDAQQAMVFLKEHINHHTPQIDRIVNSPGK